MLFEEPYILGTSSSHFTKNLCRLFMYNSEVNRWNEAWFRIGGTVSKQEENSYRAEFIFTKTFLWHSTRTAIHELWSILEELIFFHAIDNTFELYFALIVYFIYKSILIQSICSIYYKSRNLQKTCKLFIWLSSSFSWFYFIPILRIRLHRNISYAPRVFFVKIKYGSQYFYPICYAYRRENKDWRNIDYA